MNKKTVVTIIGAIVLTNVFASGICAFKNMCEKAEREERRQQRLKEQEQISKEMKEKLDQNMENLSKAMNDLALEL